MGVGDRAVVVDENNERVSSLNPRAIRRICELRGMRIGDEEEKELSKEKRGKGARRAGIMANG